MDPTTLNVIIGGAAVFLSALAAFIVSIRASGSAARAAAKLVEAAAKKSDLELIQAGYDKLQGSYNTLQETFKAEILRLHTAIDLQNDNSAKQDDTLAARRAEITKLFDNDTQQRSELDGLRGENKDLIKEISELKLSCTKETSALQVQISELKATLVSNPVPPVAGSNGPVEVKLVASDIKLAVQVENPLPLPVLIKGPLPVPMTVAQAAAAAAAAAETNPGMKQ